MNYVFLLLELKVHIEIYTNNEAIELTFTWIIHVMLCCSKMCWFGWGFIISFKIHIQVFKFNLRFLISNTDHIIDVNEATNPHQHDQINIVCPHYAAGTPEEV